MPDCVCPICHETLDNDLYTLPECNHVYHINCIITWFRCKTGNNKCPVCNNQGINTLQDLNSAPWYDRILARANYNRLRIFSRRKDAPQGLKKKVEKLKKLEQKKRELNKEFKTFKKSKHPDMTGEKIGKKYITLRRKKWILRRKIAKHQELIGFQDKIVNIIIAIQINDIILGSFMYSIYEFL